MELGTEDVKIHHSIDETFEFFQSLKSNVVAYYHNLKFDGSFWLSYLLVDLGYTQALEKLSEKEHDVKWLSEKDMPNNSIKYSISDMGQWYTILIKTNGYYIEIRDSLKLLPFSVKKIGKSFGTKHKKLDMEYEGFRYAGCTITEEERRYIANDVLVIKEALEIMFEEGHNSLTIGSCCLREFKKTFDKEDYQIWFPNLYEIPLDKDKHGVENVGEWIRKSYRGGWCYLVKGKENKIYHNGTTADVNSLYPSMMSSESGNKYPIGKPKFWTGNLIPEEALKPNRYYFVRIKTRFYLKPNMLPFIQIKSSFMYTGTESLETSDVYDKETGKYYQFYPDLHGNIKPATVELTLTMTDYELIKKHYDLIDFEILDGCYFNAEIGLFDEYMEKYKTMKMNSEGALRELAKLFLNNLYGKMASSTDSSFKVAYIKDDKSLGFYPVHECDKTPGYIPIGSAITSYSRCFTITAAQTNYHGVNERGFIYADTDSIHCDLEPHEVQGIKVHDTEFCHWKLESKWDVALFTRQKTYIEHITHESKKGVMVRMEDMLDDKGNPKKPYNNIKCAGMPQRCKDLFQMSMDGYVPKEGDKFTEEELEFISQSRTLNDFKIGLKVPSKLLPRRIMGGILLVPTTYEMR